MEKTCLLWTGPKTAGYGKLPDGRLAHRVIYEETHGPIPVGMQVDHECHNEAVAAGTCDGRGCPHRACIEPSDLMARTQRENILGGASPAALHARATTCVNGHPYDDANTYFRPDGNRDCRACNRDREAAKRRARGAGEHNGAKTHCKNGHAFTPENTYLRPDTGARACRACKRERDAVRTRSH